MSLKSQDSTKFGAACFTIFLLLWSLSAARHALLQSNAYDLGLFDQWVWLVSKGLPPYSSMEGVHILADHGAWVLYIAAIPYKFYASIHWLLASQAAGLCLTAIPLWFVGNQAGLNNKFCWLICGLWWLQPVVFNVNLFDFHPEVWAMPALAGSYWAIRAKRIWVWFLLLFFILSCRDGLILVVAGLGLEQAFRKNWKFAGIAIGLSIVWLGLLNYWLYPSLTNEQSGPKAVNTLFAYLGNNLGEVIINIFTRPDILINNVDIIGSLFYLLLVSIAVVPFWRKKSFPVLIGGVPLLLVNILSTEAPQRSLIHHYSLPIAVIVIVAVIDGITETDKQKFPWKKLAWSSICWAALAKPWFFGGHYLNRIDSIGSIHEAFSLIPSKSSVLTTSYLAPHLTHRSKITFPRADDYAITINEFDVLLLNPKDPGWGSSTEVQENLLMKVRTKQWVCKKWPNGLEACIKEKL